MGTLLEDHHYVIENIDATVIAQRPKLLSYMPEMVKNVARALGIESGQVNIKATTEEGLGFTGSGEGISAQAICLLMPLRELDGYGSGMGFGNCAGCRGCKNQR